MTYSYLYDDYLFYFNKTFYNIEDNDILGLIEKISKKKNFKNNINHGFETISDLINDRTRISNININCALDNVSNTLSFRNIFLKNSKNFIFEFKNYKPSDVINKYKEIVKNLNKKINKKDVFFQRRLTTVGLYNTELYKKKDDDDNNILLKDLYKDGDSFSLTLYLEKYLNAPYSCDNLINYIYFLRRFPLFKKMMGVYLKKNHIEISRELGNTDNDISSYNYFPLLFPDKYSVRMIGNLFQIVSDNSNMYSFFFDVRAIDSFELYYSLINLNNIFRIDYKNYNEINLTFNELFNILKDSYNTAKELNSKTEYDKIHYNIFRLYLYIIIDKKLLSNDNHNEDDSIFLNSLKSFYIDFLLLTYFLNDFLCLSSYKTPEEFIEIYDFKNFNKKIYHEENYAMNDNVNDINAINSSYQFYSKRRGGRDFYTEYQENTTIYLILISYFMYSNVNNTTNVIKHCIDSYKYYNYTFNFFKVTEPELFPLYIFLSLSNKKLKVFHSYNYKKDSMLDWLNELYDETFSKYDYQTIILKKI